MNDRISNQQSRRTFIKKTSLAGAAIMTGLSAKSYGRILGANERITVAVAGANSRGRELTGSFVNNANVNFGYLCDVDSRVLARVGEEVKNATGKAPKGFKDVRKLLEQKDLDALVIATPDHWHAPMAIMGLQAGKHIYVEKPCSHNPREGELLVEAQKKYGKVVQMGTQQRSAPTSIQAVKDIKEGIIGKVYYGKTWYVNNRGSIGNGKAVSVPDWLDWDLWQGPAPRKEYKDNYVHYHWHWFWHWGTGEVNNNAAHELDICRWAMELNYPTRVTSSGGRYHYDDDWEFYDTQNVNYEFEGGKLLTWEGRSCNSFHQYNRGRGILLHGTDGTIMLDRNGYHAYDKAGNLIKEMKEAEETDPTDIKGGGLLVDIHVQNFLSGIKDNATLNSDIEEGHKSILLCHLGNIAQENGGSLDIDPKTGRVLNNKKAMNMWERQYEAGWELKV